MFDSILASSLLSEIVTLTILSLFGLGGKYVRKWYQTYGIGALLMDIFSIVICLYLTFLIFPSNLIYQILLGLGFQMTHDILFNMLIRKVKTPILDLFKKYANEVGFKILIADGSMVVGAILANHFIFSKLSLFNNLGLSTIMFYLSMLISYSF